MKPTFIIMTVAIGVAVALVVAILVAPADGRQRRLASWMEACTTHDFTVRQCELLFALKEGAEDDAAFAAGLGAAGMAVSAGKP